MARTIQQISFPAPMRPSLKRVAAYARVSSGKDAMLHSLSAQVSYYSSLIQKHTGWLYCGVYADEAFTGTKDSRDGFQSLLAECRAGNIDMVITKSISRFARNTVTLLETVRELKTLGVDVYFEEQNIHTKCFTVDFLTKKRKVNEGEVPQYYVEHSHEPIITPEEFDKVQRYEKAKAQLERLRTAKAAREARAEAIGAFMFEMQEPDTITEFDEKLWRTTIDTVTVHVDVRMNFKFRGGKTLTSY